MHFALVAHDRPDAVARRLELRPDHLKYLDELGNALVLAGPFLDDKGDMVGSIVVIEADDLDAARATFVRDPYAAGGLFASVMVKAWRFSVNKTHK